MAEIHRKVDATSYHGGEIITPFSTAGQGYDLPIGTWRIKSYRYRVMTLIFLTVSFLLALYFLMLCEMPREHVFAVQVLNTGFATGVSRLSLSDSPELLSKAKLLEASRTKETNGVNAGRGTK